MKTLNKNVPKDAKIILEKTFLSGEIIETAYELNGKFYLVDDWTCSRPQEISKKDLEKYIRKLDKD